jgi:glycerophosphoryl diester phosphodiesterase
MMCGIHTLLAADPMEVSKPAGMRVPRHGNVFVVAHRGAHDGVPENTLAAYRRAIELGCDYVEIDVRTTVDGVLVSIHNSTIDAYTIHGGKGVVAEMTFAELREIDIGSRVDSKWSQERIPSVSEILQLCKGRIGVYLDVKNASIESLAALVKQNDCELDTLWYISGSKIDELKRHSSKSWPMPDPGPEKNLPAMLRDHCPSVVASVWRHCSQQFVETCHHSNAIVIVDDQGPETWKSLLAWNVDGIQTDHPAELIAQLKQRQSR